MRQHAKYAAIAYSRKTDMSIVCGSPARYADSFSRSADRVVSQSSMMYGRRSAAVAPRARKPAKILCCSPTTTTTTTKQSQTADSAPAVAR